MRVLVVIMAVDREKGTAATVPFLEKDVESTKCKSSVHMDSGTLLLTARQVSHF
jgi:hypothetical protein